MPSPFPGMDPFLEGPEWEDFHLLLIAEMRDYLTARVRPRYLVRAERRIYLERQSEQRDERIRPDVAVLTARGTELATGEESAMGQRGVSPALLTLPVPEERREAFLVVRLRHTMDLVAVIEILSPTNKRRGSDGRREYLAKRETVLRSATHLIELDLLRGGERLPTMEPLPAADYYAFVSRGNQRPQTQVFFWGLRDTLPAIPVPLAGNDSDVSLGLAELFDRVYDRAGYDYSLDHHASLSPRLSAPDEAWVRQLLRGPQADSGG